MTTMMKLESQKWLLQMYEVDERLILDDVGGDNFEQRQQRQTKMIVAEFTQLPYHQAQVPHRQRLHNSTLETTGITTCISQKRSPFRKIFVGRADIYF